MSVRVGRRVRRASGWLLLSGWVLLSLVPVIGLGLTKMLGLGF